MNFKKVIGSVAPFLGALVGGPFGAAAGKLIGSALLGDEDATQQQLEEAIGMASPEQLVKLKEIDAETKVKYAEIGLDERRIAAMDRDSARDREVRTNDKTPSRLAWLVTLGFFGLLGALLFINIPKDAIQIINIMVGVLGTAWVGIITYYFGSSSASDKKDILLKEKIS